MRMFVNNESDIGQCRVVIKSLKVPLLGLAKYIYYPFGRYRYLRMPMGLRSAPEVHQQRMAQVFQGLPGVKVIVDDIIIHG